MVDARTESEAEAGLIHVTMGGQGYDIPVLPIVKSDRWQAEMGRVLANLDDGLDPSLDGASALTEVLRAGSQAQIHVLLAYDQSDVLGGEEAVGEHMSQRELWEAVERILDAEFPFDEAGKRSVGEMFGLPLKTLEIVTQAVTDEASRRAKYPNGLSPIGDSPTPASDKSGPVNNSPSAGATARGGSRKRRKRA